MGENNEERIVMLTIKEVAALVEGLTEYRVRQMCINDQVPHIMAGKKYLINKELVPQVSAWGDCVKNSENVAILLDFHTVLWYDVVGKNEPYY